jgi:hypothetical protein
MIACILMDCIVRFLYGLAYEAFQGASGDTGFHLSIAGRSLTGVELASRTMATRRWSWVFNIGETLEGAFEAFCISTTSMFGNTLPKQRWLMVCLGKFHMEAAFS